MFCNVGPAERVARLLLAGAAFVPLMSGRKPPRFRTWAAVAAGAELFTAVTRFCPVNLLLGINGCRRRSVLGSAARLAASAVPGGRYAVTAADVIGTVGRWAARRSDSGDTADNDADGDDGRGTADDNDGGNTGLLIAGVGALAFGVGLTAVLHSGRNRVAAAIRDSAAPLADEAKAISDRVDPPIAEAMRAVLPHAPRGPQGSQSPAGDAPAP